MALLLLGTAVCFGTSSCDDPTCCEMYENGPDTEYARQMCHNSMLFDNKYDLRDGCFLKEVDRYIEAAENCCAPLKSKMDYEFLSVTDLTEDNSMVSVVARVTFSDNSNYSGGYVPANAYTHCLFETNPRTYQCDIQKAQQFEAELNQCCGALVDVLDRSECITSFVSKQKCEKKCCAGLPSDDNDNYISKTHCEQLLKSSGECIETRSDACCRIAPIEPSRGHIDRNICKQIYTESNGECVNTDEKYELYKNK